MTTRLVRQLAAGFWESAGAAEPFPRSLERPIMSTHPVFIVRIPRLGVNEVTAWLNRKGLQFPLDTTDRPLYGCLLAYHGNGIIFIDGSLPDDETRMVIAHEFGHFLAEYDRPRREAANRLGTGVLEVLDGDRVPTRHEGIAASLAGVVLGVHVHFMDRTFNDSTRSIIQTVERTADLLAYELIAPGDHVMQRVRTIPDGVTTEFIVTVLQTEYGMPARWAAPYAHRLISYESRHRSFSSILGLTGSQ